MSSMGWVPTFNPCKTCGELTTGTGDCFDCERGRHRRRESVQAFEHSLPESLRWARFDEPDLLNARVERHAIAKASECVSSRKVVLLGPSGEGKTSLAVAMARQWVREHAKPAAFVLATDLATARRRSPLGREAPEVVDALTVPLLVLDDLGTDAADPSSAVTEVIFKRHAEDRAMWITTWMNPAAMETRYGQGVMRRVYQGARIVELGAIGGKP